MRPSARILARGALSYEVAAITCLPASIPRRKGYFVRNPCGNAASGVPDPRTLGPPDPPRPPDPRTPGPPRPPWHPRLDSLSARTSGPPDPRDPPDQRRIAPFLKRRLGLPSWQPTGLRKGAKLRGARWTKGGERHAIPIQNAAISESPLSKARL
jgi:hypothetical protein